MRRIIAAAREGKTVLEFPVYDGSETGEKLYNTLTVIGRADRARRQDADRRRGEELPALAKLTRWPVTISYFDKTTRRPSRPASRRRSIRSRSSCTRTASRARCVLDYSDFTISGEMTSLEI